MSLSRAQYAQRYGPTTGDRIRLGDTDLWIRVESDSTAPGDEPMWGYGKNLRSRMLQAEPTSSASELDMVVLGAVLVDPLLGVIKTDLGIKDGRIARVGRAGNPDLTGGVDLQIGPNTWPLGAQGLIATAGAVDSHVHLITPRLVPVALAAGVTTLITAGFEEPPHLMEATLRAFEHLPINLGLQASARSEAAGPLEQVLAAGACGLKIHEDWGAYPEIIDRTLALADAHDVAVCLHTDGLNESCELDDTVAAIRGRSVHAYHVEGTGGGHVPDLIALVREPNIICSSTTPTLPYGRAAVAEHLAMILAVHGGSAHAPDDVAAAAERIHPATMAAEGPLHELGAISIVNSDSQGMGRIGETVRRTWQLAHAMKRWRETEAGAGWPAAPAVRLAAHGAGVGKKAQGAAGAPARPTGGADADDNQRVLRYLAKYTAEPALVHGIAHEVGSLAPGHLADIVLWHPAQFGVRPALVLKAGVFAWGPHGGGNAAVEGAEPRRYGPHWAGLGIAAPFVSRTFVSRAAIEAGLGSRLGSRRELVAVRGTRTVRRASLVANRAVPPVEVDPDSGTVRLGGRVLAMEAVGEVPLNRRYLLG